ncbi:hypothetical protein KP803_09260 [Vibrio sp. ZSDE26]|uniref:PAS domain-containing protein n=1 Tax=Vibrio amylolyticus TaxID=2847292 RepID=A0A9X1XJV6_9VIBR|nr:CHASE4 domain-containing protein [Vibrio amylolyticus]MCK6263460.1 hypothetical protein [Vibrio amylolyticus]
MKIKKASRLNSSIEFRLTAIFIGLFIVISIIFSSMSTILANKITKGKDLNHTQQLSELALNVISLKYDTSIQFTLDYSYWSELASYTNRSHRDTATYKRLLHHLLDYGFESISVYSKNEDLLFLTAQPDTVLEIHQHINNFANLNNYGDLDFQIVVESEKMYVIATRAIFNEENLFQPTGFIAFTKHIDNFFIDDVSSIIGSKLELIPEDNSAAVSFTELPSIKGIFEDIDDSNNATFRLIANNEKTIPFKLQLQRPHSDFITKELLTLIVFEIAIVIILVLFFFLILKNYVTKPIVQMNQWLSNDPSNLEPFQYPYDDELSSLAQNIESNHVSLMDSLQFNQDLLNAISDIIITTDEHLNITYCNPAAHNWLGKTPHYITGQPIDFLLQVIKGDTPSYWFAKVFNENQSYSSVCTIKSVLSESDSTITANITVKPIEHGKRAVAIIKPTVKSETL